MPRPQLALNLFWRTFALLALLMAGGVLTWQHTFKLLEAEPRALEAAQQIAGLVNLSRAALADTDSINRVAVITSIARSETVQVRVAKAADVWQPYDMNAFATRLASEMRGRLGPRTVVARSVNSEPGLWVRFAVGEDAFWLQTSAAPLSVSVKTNWWWVLVALGGTAMGSVLITRLINHPLRELSIAAGHIRDGEYDSRLDEHTLTSEIREVNMGFNRMARELAKVEEDRAVMLAGISHDLRTPLARMRLEAEMSVVDEEAKRNMAADIDQLDAIIDKFMDYARPGEVELVPVHVSSVVDKAISQFRDTKRIRITAKLPIDTRVMADETELGRVLTNLFENARRYGRNTYTGVTNVDVSYTRSGAWVILSVRDHGPGVAPEKLSQLTTPFFRGDAARTAATGAGLGLAIVEKALHRMGGAFEIANAPGGGLVAHIRLKRAP